MVAKVVKKDFMCVSHEVFLWAKAGSDYWSEVCVLM